MVYQKLKQKNLFREILGDTNQAVIIRTSWLMGTISKNFLLTMIKFTSNKKRDKCGF